MSTSSPLKAFHQNPDRKGNTTEEERPQLQLDNHG
ncbi:hypothetical protein OROMI_012708 [Orobanche minor]